VAYTYSVGKPVGESLVIRPFQRIPWRGRKLKVFAKRLMVARNQGGTFVTSGKEYPIADVLAISQANKEVHFFFCILTRPT
jgi:hypothetical protein